MLHSIEHPRPDGSPLTLRLAEVNVSVLASRVVQQYRPAAEAKGLRMLAVLPDCADIRLDAVLFEQVMRQLVDNALKFTPFGLVTVAVIADPATSRPRRVIVSDTGIGIASHRLARLFEPAALDGGEGTQPAASYRRGLPFVRHVCEEMGCGLHAESNVAVGSKFTITFPHRASA